MTTAMDELMVAFYAAVTAMQDGGVGEVEIERTCEDATEPDVTIRITIRRSVQAIHVGAPMGDDDD